MDAVFSRSAYVLKRKGLAIAGAYELLDLERGETLLWVHEKMKWLPPSRTWHIYADEAKGLELITLKDSDRPDVDLDVIDPESGELLGGVGSVVDTASEMVLDAFEITGPDSARIAKAAETPAAGSALRHIVSSDLPQSLEVTVDGVLVGTFRQAVKAVAYELAIDLSADSAHVLDPRLAIAAAVWVANHQVTGV